MNTERMVIKHVGARSRLGAEPAWCCVVCEDATNKHGAMVMVYGELADYVIRSQELAGITNREIEVERPSSITEWPQPRGQRYCRELPPEQVQTMRIVADLLEGLPDSALRPELDPNGEWAKTVEAENQAGLDDMDFIVTTDIDDSFCCPMELPRDPVGAIMRQFNAEEDL